MPDDDSDKLNIRIAYLSERIDAYIVAAKQQNTTLYAIHDAARTIAIETFALEDEWIRPHVGHHANGSQLLCRHKIIAATQCAIMRHAPLRNNEEELSSNFRAKEEGMWALRIRELNARFATKLAVEILALYMMEYKQPESSWQYLESPVFYQTYRENIYWLTRSLAVTAHNTIPYFPFLLVSQFWSMIDRHAMVQGGGQFPVYKEESLPPAQ